MNLHGLQMPGRAREAYADTAVLPGLLRAFLARAEDDQARDAWLRKAGTRARGGVARAGGPEPRGCSAGLREGPAPVG